MRAVKCYELTQHFPQSELYGLTSQIRRSAVSVASNIASQRADGRRQEAEGLTKERKYKV
jgi:four helix bundle protein